MVPTALERAGDFSQSTRKPNDPLTGLPFPGNVIPASRFDIAAKTIQDKYVPLSNLPNSFYEVRAPDPLRTDETTLKLDHQLSATQSVAVSYFFLNGRRHAAVDGHRQHPVGRSRLPVDAAQHQLHAHLDDEART